MAPVLVLLMAVLVSGDVNCPDGGTCSDGETCCEQESGHSCCAYPNAVCCPGETHCCPEGFSCNAQNHSCDRVDKVPGTEVLERKAKFYCPGQYCQDGSYCCAGTTCCLIGPYWSCCYHSFAAKKALQPRLATGAHARPRPPPYLCPNGRLCNFGSHCCFTDQGWSCCSTYVPYEQERAASVSLQKTSSKIIAEYCPDGSYCSPGRTCCMTQCGWTCCIPQRFTHLASRDAHISVTIPANPVKPSVAVVTCDAHRSCLSGQTCCKHPKGTFSCCPFPEGECCHDGFSCCNRASGWSCGLNDTCVFNGMVIPEKPQPKE
ncbi:progranulin-like [Pygocentrus nattereri]|uniref:progranulin-like n=1 Tax=Pygocentrus nattereri TaxID=42514 RepID=UPI0018916A30|nr:progranulin-like [Pygocentrus nattereri]